MQIIHQIFGHFLCCDLSRLMRLGIPWLPLYWISRYRKTQPMGKTQPNEHRDITPFEICRKCYSLCSGTTSHHRRHHNETNTITQSSLSNYICGNTIRVLCSHVTIIRVLRIFITWPCMLKYHRYDELLPCIQKKDEIHIFQILLWN